MEYKEFTAKNVDDAITEACESFCVTSDKLDYEVVSNGSSGFLGINAKPAIIKARVKEDKKEEIKIRQSIGEAVPTAIFRQIAENIKKCIRSQN